MSTTAVDTLVTRFLYDASGTEKGKRDVLGATKEIAGATGTAVKDIAKLAVGAGAALGVGLLAFGKKALDQATQFDTLERSLTAVTKSGQRAKDILKFDDNLALPSIFESKDLAQASLTLEAFGLKTEKYLPVVEKLGTVFGGTTESLKQYVDALGMIKGGRFGEGFESLARAGISRKDLTAQYGLQFDKGGEFKGSVEQALDAIEKIVNDRFGKLSKEMADSPAAALGSLGDIANKIERKAGQSILRVYLPALRAVTDELNRLDQNNEVEKVADAFSGMFSGKDIGAGLVKMIDATLAGVKEIPGWIDKNKDKFKEIVQEGKEIGSLLAKDVVPTAERLLGTAEKLLKVFTSLPEPVQQLLLVLGLTNRATGGLVGSVAGAIGGIKVPAGADATASLGGLLMKTITGPIGLIGSVLIAGALSLAEATRKGIDAAVENKAVENAVPELKTDPTTGRVVPFNNKGKGHLSPEEKKAKEKDIIVAMKEEKRKARIKQLTGLDVDEEQRKAKELQDKANANTPPDPGASPPVYQGVLERIAKGIEKQVDIQTQLFGGSTLATDATSAYGVHNALKARGRTAGATPIAQALDDLAAAIHAEISSQSPLNQRVRMSH